MSLFCATTVYVLKSELCVHLQPCTDVASRHTCIVGCSIYRCSFECFSTWSSFLFFFWVTFRVDWKHRQLYHAGLTKPIFAMLVVSLPNHLTVMFYSLSAWKVHVASCRFPQCLIAAPLWSRRRLILRTQLVSSVSVCLCVLRWWDVHSLLAEEKSLRFWKIPPRENVA